MGELEMVNSGVPRRRTIAAKHEFLNRSNPVASYLVAVFCSSLIFVIWMGAIEVTSSHIHEVSLPLVLAAATRNLFLIATCTAVLMFPPFTLVAFA